jgi:hypothetical protein
MNFNPFAKGKNMIFAIGIQNKLGGMVAESPIGGMVANLEDPLQLRKQGYGSMMSPWTQMKGQQEQGEELKRKQMLAFNDAMQGDM